MNVLCDLYFAVIFVEKFAAMRKANLEDDDSEAEMANGSPEESDEEADDGVENDSNLDSSDAVTAKGRSIKMGAKVWPDISLDETVA